MPQLLLQGFPEGAMRPKSSPKRMEKENGADFLEQTPVFSGATLKILAVTVPNRSK
jgi:hypothetical protein